MAATYGVFGVIIITALIVALLFWRTVRGVVVSLEDKTMQRFFQHLSIAFGLWLVLALVLALSPVFRTPWVLAINTPVFLVLSIFLPTITNLLLLRSESYRRLVRAVPLHRIVLLNSLRIVFGLALLALYSLGYLAPHFGLHAGIGDITVGLLAIPVALLLWRKAKYALTLAAVWNTLGILDLLNALRLGLTELIPFVLSTQTELFIGMVPLVAVPLYVIWHVHSTLNVYNARISVT
ncbi:MAG: hypothetical protein ACRCYY_00810 [Trueperaceae bacterium]